MEKALHSGLIFFWLPASLGMGAGALVLALAGLGWGGVAAGGSVAAAGLACGWLLSGRHAKALGAIAAPLDEARAGLDQICVQAGPIWAKQIETVRAQTEESVNAQVERFSGIIAKIGAALAESRDLAGDLGSKRDGGIPAVIRECEAELARVVGAVKTSHQIRETLLAEVAEVMDLRQVMQELKDMVTEVTAIGLQTKLLAYNAAIEAAHAGDQGRSFAVVAGEMRQLSTRSSETVQKMSKKVGAINTALSGVFEDTERFAAQDKEAESNARSAIARVLARFGEVGSLLSRSSQLLQAESEGIRDEISQVLVSLQYQDRTSQILTHVIKGMQELHERLGQDSQLLEQMRRAYSTREEHRNHELVQARVVAPAPNMTYF
jgi:methyl-accepting chemotaxis protein